MRNSGNSSPLAHSITAMQFVYIATAGFALADGSRQYFDPDGGDARFRWGSDLVIFLLFVTTVVRFAHGALRHFDTAIENERSAHAWDPLIDFVGLFVQAVIFVFLASSQANERAFSTWLLILIGVATVWLTLTHGKPSGGDSDHGNWVVTNSLYLVAIPVLVIWGEHTKLLLWTLSVIAILHTTMDYASRRNWDFYFPNSRHPQELDSFWEAINPKWSEVRTSFLASMDLVYEVVLLGAAIAIWFYSLFLRICLFFFYGVWWIIVRVLRAVSITSLAPQILDALVGLRNLFGSTVQRRRPITFIIGPYAGSPAEITKNIQSPEEAAISVWKVGFAAFTPHLNTAHFEEKASVVSAEDFQAFDLELLRHVDAVLTFGDWQQDSVAKEKVEYAKKLGKRVFTSADELRDHYYDR